MSTIITPKTGVMKMEDSDYFAIDAVNASKLKQFRIAPVLSQMATEETAAMSMGSLIHCAILEPNEIEKRYLITDIERRGTKAWDAEEAAATAEGKEMIKRKDMEQALFMRDAVWANATARECLDGAETEIACLWQDETTGLACKAKADAINRKLGYIIDVKTTVSAHPEEFSKQFSRLGYWLQESWYRWGFAENGFGELVGDPTPFLFIAIEKGTGLVATYEMTRDDHSKSYKELYRLLEGYSECTKTGIWPGYPDYSVINLPAWAI
ncbi:MAG: PD-(D/E)XK nuclease-like domain-containing protein [Methylococcaceae bacterium]